MKIFLQFIVFVLFINVCVQCNQLVDKKLEIPSERNQIRYASGFSLCNYNGFSILKVTHPWPKASRVYTYILKKKYGIVPDSLKQFLTINIPIKTIIVTSTTHIPSIEMLEEAATLVGFPNLNYISSEKIRALIDSKKVKEVGTNQTLNTEVIIDLQPDVIVGYGINNQNPSIDKLEKSGLKVLLNGDWNEETPLGKAEWIKFFGALYCKQKKAEIQFLEIEKEYLKTIAIAKKAITKPTVLVGDMYEDKWYLPKGGSWGSQLLKEAKTDYLWSNTIGTGSLSLSFETVFEKAKNANFWFTSGQFSSLKDMAIANPHYEQLDAFKNKKVYSFCGKRGKTGGALYYELGPNRPDIVLKDILKIVHPELLKGYKPFFFEKLK